jgi:hypothetical protein
LLIRRLIKYRHHPAKLIERQLVQFAVEEIEGSLEAGSEFGGLILIVNLLA